MASSDLKPACYYSLLIIGDLMLGRLIDALLPTSIARKRPASDPENAARVVDLNLLPQHPDLRSYTYISPWGNSVDLIRSADVVLANLETALTTSEHRWENKAFNYRSHVANVRCLTEVGMGNRRGYVSLANNHTLDWGLEGLFETVKTLKESGVEFAGAGRSKDEAASPGILQVGGDGGAEVRCWSFTDHPRDWQGIDCFNLIEYTQEGRQAMKKQIMSEGWEARPGLKVVSMHWGPNYRWHPAEEIVDLAHWLIDVCDIDIIHGHSSHHIQGVEVYKGKLIMYGCGDFVDDYAVNDAWRNDLSAAWRVTVGVKAGDQMPLGRLEVKRLEVFPSRIERFQAKLLEVEDSNHAWVVTKFTDLCLALGTRVGDKLEAEGEITVDVNSLTLD